jgi:hypothetical protein
VNSIVNANYDKPIAPDGLSDSVINKVENILDVIYNKKNDLNKYPTQEVYITYLDRMNL